MASPQNLPAPKPRLADRLTAARRFVGRAAELELFRSALAADVPAFAVLYLVGPGGVGKSSLLRQFADLAIQAGRSPVLLDCRNVDVSPQGFLLALGQELGLDPAESPLPAVEQAQRPVLLLDTYETLGPLDGWLRDVFLPQLPAGALTVIAGRSSPSAGWRSASDWHDLVRIISLRNLHPDESLVYLQQRGVPTAQHAEVLRFTHGHPLALSLMADVAAQRGEVAFHANQAPDVVALLVERFVQDVPSPQHRLALHACAIARVLTESLLRAALDQPDVQVLFAWLRSLSFIEQGPFGLFPHDLAREVLDSDLRWRDPDTFVVLQRRLLDATVQRVLASQGLESARAVFDLIYLHRHNPVLQPYYRWTEFGTLYAEPVRPAEHAALISRVAEFASADAARLAEFWLARQPQAWHVIRDGRGSLVGMFMYLALHATTPTDHRFDPAVGAAWQYAQQHAPLRPGDEITLARYFAARDRYFQPSPEMNTAQLAVGMRWMTNPRLAWSFCDVHEPDHWRAIMSYFNFHRVPDTPYGLYAHDWRATPLPAWIDLVGSRAAATDLRVEDLAAATTAALVVLSQPEFAEAVKNALRDYKSLSALALNPLMRSRLVRDSGGTNPSAVTLQDLLRTTAVSLQARPKDVKYFRALDATYFTPSTTQELAAERLGLPFSTYRYHLTQGIERLTDALWQRELYGPDAP